MDKSVTNIAIPALHYWALIFLAALWSSSFLVIKVSVASIPPLTLTALRLFFAMAVLWCVLIYKGELLPSSPKIWFMCFWVGFFGNVLPFSLIGWGEEVVESGLTAVLMAIMPLSTVVLAHFFTKGDRLTPQRFLGIAIGFLGIVILVGPSVFGGLGEDGLRQLAIAMAGLSYGITTVIARNMPQSSILGRSVAIMIAGFLFLLPFALWFDKPWTLEPSNTAIIGAIHLGIFPTALASLIYLHLIGVRGAGFMAYINYLIPIMGVILGAALLGEKITVQVVAALSAILIGLFVANVRMRRLKPK
jgi:drug/metabolite transporter (DMT)-like permease